MGESELLQVDQVEEIGLLTPKLAARDILQRFSDPEKIGLAQLAMQVWNESIFNRQEAQIVELRDGYFKWGEYVDGEARALSTPQGRALADELQGQDLYAVVNLETLLDVFIAKGILSRISPSRVTLGTMYVPCQRGERPEPDKGNSDLHEEVLFDDLVDFLRQGEVERMVLVDSHAPGDIWFCLRHGMAVLDITALPAMIIEAKKQGFLEDQDLIIAMGDEGAREMGLLVGDLIRAKEFIQGKKDKVNGKTIVTFKREDLEKVRGKTVVMGEDIISTGGTMASGINELLEAGAKRVVVLVTYPIFAGKAVENLTFDDRVQFVTTDGRKPLNDISKLGNVTVVPMMGKINSVLELDKLGVDFWSEQGLMALWNLGFCLAPWQTYAGR